MSSNATLLLIGVFVAAIGSLLGALIVQLATKRVVKFKPKYKTAYEAAFLGYLGSFTTGFLISLFGGILNSESTEKVLTLTMVVSFFVSSVIYGLIISHPNTGPIGFSNGCKISLVQLIIELIVVGVIMIVFLLPVFFLFPR